MSASTANAAQKALVTRLQARPLLAGALVQIGLPAEVPTETDRIYLASVDELTRTGHPAGLGASNRIFEEEYTLAILVETHRIDRDARTTVTDRMWQIVAEIETELTKNPELADDVDDAYVASIPSAFTIPATDGWIGKAIVRVNVTAVVRLG